MMSMQLCCHDAYVVHASTLNAGVHSRFGLSVCLVALLMAWRNIFMLDLRDEGSLYSGNGLVAHSWLCAAKGFAVWVQEIIPVEGLVLESVEPGLYDLHCLPMKLVDADGAPARCILR